MGIICTWYVGMGKANQNLKNSKGQPGISSQVIRTGGMITFYTV